MCQNEITSSAINKIDRYGLHHHNEHNRYSLGFQHKQVTINGSRIRALPSLTLFDYSCNIMKWWPAGWVNLIQTHWIMNRRKHSKCSRCTFIVQRAFFFNACFPFDNYTPDYSITAVPEFSKLFFVSLSYWPLALFSIVVNEIFSTSLGILHWIPTLNGLCADAARWGWVGGGKTQTVPRNWIPNEDILLHNLSHH